MSQVNDYIVDKEVTQKRVPHSIMKTKALAQQIVMQQTIVADNRADDTISNSAEEPA